MYQMIDIKHIKDDKKEKNNRVHRDSTYLFDDHVGRFAWNEKTGRKKRKTK